VLTKETDMLRKSDTMFWPSYAFDGAELQLEERASA